MEHHDCFKIVKTGWKYIELEAKEDVGKSLRKKKEDNSRATERKLIKRICMYIYF